MPTKIKTRKKEMTPQNGMPKEYELNVSHHRSFQNLFKWFRKVLEAIFELTVCSKKKMRAMVNQKCRSRNCTVKGDGEEKRTKSNVDQKV